MIPRLYVRGETLSADSVIPLDEGAARHAQVLRMQPGHAVVLFDGRGGEWTATVEAMGRRDVTVRVVAHHAVSREIPLEATLAVGVPANDRMDALVEKATELGVMAIQPLMCSRSVVRLDGERAIKKVAHWQAIAVAASEQSGRTRVPVVHPMGGLTRWLESVPPSASRAVLSFQPEISLGHWLEEMNLWRGGAAAAAPIFTLSGPEGGLTEEEEAAACRLGWRKVGLGNRVLRADTAPLAVMGALCALTAKDSGVQPA